MATEEHAARLRIIVERPPPGVDYGLQQGRGAAFTTVQTQRSGAGDLSFELTVRARIGRPGAAPVLLGPFVQGPPGARFLYLDIGTCAGQTGTPWSRRLKIPLTGITRDDVVRQAADPRALLEARVPGTAGDGGPSCGTVKPFAGWRPARRRAPAR